MRITTKSCFFFLVLLFPFSLFGLTETQANVNQCSTSYTINGLDNISSNLNETTNYYTSGYNGSNTNIYFTFTPATDGNVTLKQDAHPWGNANNFIFVLGTACDGNNIVPNTSYAGTNGPYEFSVTQGQTYYLKLTKENIGYTRFSLIFSFVVGAAGNNPPSAEDDIANTAINTSVTINPLTNDSDIDGDSLSVGSVTTPAHGTLSSTTSTITYTPNQGWVGTESFDYTLSDGTATDTATITVTTVDTSLDPTIPEDDNNSIEGICGTFEDVLQTRQVPSKIQHLPSAGAIIFNSPDCTLNTGDVDFGTYQSLECSGGFATATGTYGAALDINYSNPPQQTTLSSTPASSSDDVTVTTTPFTLSAPAYNEVKIGDGGTGDLNVTFEHIHQINNLNFTTNNEVIFNTPLPYNLEIGSVGIVNNGSGNTLKTNTIPEHIKIKEFDLPGKTTIDFEARQTIKMETLKIGRAQTSVKLKAPYVQINSLNQSNDYGDTSEVTIIADYVDITQLQLDQEATIIFKPYTPGKNILFRSDSITASSSSTMILDSGDYYTKSFDIPGSADVSSVRASDANQIINFYIDGDFTPGNNPGINSNGNDGNFGDLPPTNFFFLVNGNLETGGGGTTFNATVYVEGNATFGSPSYLKGAFSSNGTISIGNSSEFTYDGDTSNPVFNSCSGATATLISGPFDAWDTFRDNSPTPPLDRNISTKIVNKPFHLSLASLNKTNDDYETKMGIGSMIGIAIYPSNSNTKISNELFFDVNTTAHITTTAMLTPNSGFTVNRAERNASVGFKFCATYENNTTINDTVYFLYPNSFCSSLSIIHDCNATTSSAIPTWHICKSRDNFAIRPYSLKAFGKNQYKRAGEDFNITILAVDENNDAVNSGQVNSNSVPNSVSAVSDYNTSLSHLNIISTFYQPTEAQISRMQTNTDKTDVITCPSSGVFTINNLSDIFVNGEINASLKFNETGILDLNISEKPGYEWAIVDADDTNDTVRYIKPSTQTFDETDISKNTLLAFVPYQFDTSATYETTNEKNWLYMHDINQSNSTFITPQMAAYVTYTITAKGKDGNTLQNYTKTCFPDVKESDPYNPDTDCPQVNGLKLNTTFDLYLDVTINSTKNVDLSLYTEDNASSAIFTPNKNISIVTGANSIQEWISPFQFENGVGKAKVYFNIDRNLSKTINPVVLSVIDANTSTSWMANAGSPKYFYGITLNSNKNFLYGRAHAPRQSFVDNSIPIDHDALVYYEVFCDGTDCNKTLLPNGITSTYNDDPRWFTNTQHTAISGTAGNVSERTSTGSITYTAQPTGNHQDKVTLQYDGTKGYPFIKTFTNNASLWLIYDKYNPGATRNDFTLEFNKDAGEYVGSGDSTSDVNITRSSTLNANENKSWW